MLSLAHSGGWTGECERRGAGMCPAWRQVHLTRPASCTPARALQHSSQSLSKCAGASSTTITPPNRAFSTCDWSSVSVCMFAAEIRQNGAQKQAIDRRTCQPRGGCTMYSAVCSGSVASREVAVASSSSPSTTSTSSAAFGLMVRDANAFPPPPPPLPSCFPQPVPGSLVAQVHVSAEGGSAPLCPTLNPYLPIKG